MQSSPRQSFRPACRLVAQVHERAGRVRLVAMLVAVLLVVRHYEADLPSVADLKGNYNPPQVTRVLARDGTLLAELFTERRTVIPIATLARPREARRARRRRRRLLRARRAQLLRHAARVPREPASRRTRQGGSTITQQVVKNVLLDPERTLQPQDSRGASWRGGSSSKSRRTRSSSSI